MSSVSVIIPTIGRVDRLHRALCSVASQTRLPEEVIVVSKSNKDKLTNEVESFDIPIDIIEQKGTGLSNARNEGIKASSESLIAFLDDDDWWKPEKIERQVQVIRNEDTAFVFTGIEHVDETGNTINFRIPTDKPSEQEILTQNAVGAPSTVLAKRSCLNAIGGFDEELPSREEWDMYIRLLEKFDCQYIPDPLVVKESHDEAMSNDIDLVERDWMALYRKHDEKYDKNTKQDFYSNYHFDIGRISCKDGDFQKGRKHFQNSIEHSNSPTRIPHYVATFFGETGYAFFTKVYRSLKKRSAIFKHKEDIQTASQFTSNTEEKSSVEQ